MTNQSNKVVSLEAYRCAGTKMNAPADATVQYGTSDDPSVVVIQNMRFDELCNWLTEQTRIRETMMIQALVRFSGEGTSRIDKAWLATRPDPSLFEAMPFEVKSTKEGAVMMNAYDYMVGQGRYPAESILAAFPDDWVALESVEASHGCVPRDAYEATAAWPK